MSLQLAPARRMTSVRRRSGSQAATATPSACRAASATSRGASRLASRAHQTAASHQTAACACRRDANPRRSHAAPRGSATCQRCRRTAARRAAAVRQYVAFLSPPHARLLRSLLTHCAAPSAGVCWTHRARMSERCGVQRTYGSSSSVLRTGQRRVARTSHGAPDAMPRELMAHSGHHRLATHPACDARDVHDQLREPVRAFLRELPVAGVFSWRPRWLRAVVCAEPTCDTTTVSAVCATTISAHTNIGPLRRLYNVGF
jgi:hypothetical protein